MAQRNMKAVYVAVLFTSLILYGAGIWTGITIQQSLVESVEKDLNSIKSDIENQQQELILFSLRGKESCAILQSVSSSTATKLDAVSNEIRQLEQSGQKDERFNLMKETYSSLSIRAWILISAINENCNKQIASILYYYSFPCANCEAQEDTLNQVKSAAPDKILTYAVDKDVNNSLVQTLVKSHGIDYAPSVVLGNEVYKGLTEKGVIEGFVCNEINISCGKENITTS